MKRSQNLLIFQFFFFCTVKNTALMSFKSGIDEMKIDIKHVKRKDLNQYLKESDLKKFYKDKPIREKVIILNLLLTLF